jgi:phage terminase small subunit
MARQRNPNRDVARTLWEADKSRTLSSIAQELGLPESRIRKWKCEDKWEQDSKGAFRLTQKERSDSKRLNKKLVQAVEQNEELTEKEKAFCIHFVKSFNAAAACRAAGYETAYPAQVGWELLQKPHIKAEVQRLKELRNLSMMGGAEDVLELHWRIAFADMSDYADWGGGIVTFKSSKAVDGQLVKEIKQGEMGLGLKLADKQKSLAFLEQYFELHPMDKHKKAFDEAKLALEQQKAQSGQEPPVHDDGFLDAMKATAGEVWTDEDSGDVPV